MIGVDTNVLLRHILQDDPVQSPAASRFFAERSANDPAYIGRVVLAETIWNLARHHGFPPSRVGRVVEVLLSSRDSVLEDEASVRRALYDSERDNADLADAIIAHAAVDAGADGIVTFDTRAQRLPGMLPVE